MWNFRRWESAMLLSIIIPISLLTTFRLTGVLHEPALISETITTNTISWNMSRPTDFPFPNVNIVTIDEVVSNYYYDETIFINSTILIGEYIEKELGWPSDGDDDVVHLTHAVSVDVSEGYVYSTTLRFSVADVNSILLIEPDPNATFSHNLKIDRIYDPVTSKREGHINAVGVNQPSTVYLETFTFLVFTDENNLDHWIQSTYEIIYFNGTAFRKIAVPIQLGMLAL